MPECQKIKNGGLDQYGTERSARLTFVTIGKNVGMKGLIYLPGVDDFPHDASTSLRQFLDVSIHLRRHGQPTLRRLSAGEC